MSNRLDQERESEFQPKRMEYAKQQISALGYEIIDEEKTWLKFNFKGHDVTLYPYSGWHTGRSIVDGRGIGKLLKQINTINKL